MLEGDVPLSGEGMLAAGCTVAPALALPLGKTDLESVSAAVSLAVRSRGETPWNEGAPVVCPFPFAYPPSTNTNSSSWPRLSKLGSLLLSLNSSHPFPCTLPNPRSPFPPLPPISSLPSSPCPRRSSPSRLVLPSLADVALCKGFTAAPPGGRGRAAGTCEWAEEGLPGEGIGAGKGALGALGCRESCG